MVVNYDLSLPLPLWLSLSPLSVRLPPRPPTMLCPRLFVRSGKLRSEKVVFTAEIHLAFDERARDGEMSGAREGMESNRMLSRARGCRNLALTKNANAAPRWGVGNCQLYLPSRRHKIECKIIS